MARVIFLIIMVSLCLVGPVKADIIEGFITNVNTIEEKISIDDATYNLNKGCIIKVNGKRTNLKGIKPPVNNFYKWAYVRLENEEVTAVYAYYKVYEGRIVKISETLGWLSLDIYQQNDLSTSPQKFYFPIDLKNKIKAYKEQDEIVLVIAKNKIIYIP